MFIPNNQAVAPINPNQSFGLEDLNLRMKLRDVTGGTACEYHSMLWVVGEWKLSLPQAAALSTNW